MQEIFWDWLVKVLEVKNYKCMLTFFFYFLNQLMTSVGSFYWYKLAVFLSLLFILSRMDLIILTIPFFEGLIYLVFELFMKFGVSSLSYIKRSLKSTKDFVCKIYVFYDVFSFQVDLCSHVFIKIDR